MRINLRFIRITQDKKHNHTSYEMKLVDTKQNNSAEGSKCKALGKHVGNVKCYDVHKSNASKNKNVDMQGRQLPKLYNTPAILFVQC